jgi:hypothetical protein
MSNINSRIEKLETQQAINAARLTWKQFIEIDAEGIKQLMATDPNFAAAWNELAAQAEEPDQQETTGE